MSTFPFEWPPTLISPGGGTAPLPIDEPPDLELNRAQYETEVVRQIASFAKDKNLSLGLRLACALCLIEAAETPES